MNILVLNCGSSSVKFAVSNPETGTCLTEGKVDRIGETLDHAQALERALQSVKGLEIAAVGHRVVHGGQKFHDAVRIDDVVLAEIERCVPLAPLHNPANIAGIRAALAALPSLPQVAVFDTAFHARLPRRARTYAIDTELAEKHGIRRYGFHGTSHDFVTKRVAAHLRRPLSELRIVSLHLGNGASACAVEFGHSTETSMGMTPLEGLVMGTRAGDIDAGALLALMRGEGLDADGLDEILNERSGLTGLSGVGNDLRDIECQGAAKLIRLGAGKVIR
jgi:acetate kinase